MNCIQRESKKWYTKSLWDITKKSDKVRELLIIVRHYNRWHRGLRHIFPYSCMDHGRQFEWLIIQPNPILHHTCLTIQLFLFYHLANHRVHFTSIYYKGTSNKYLTKYGHQYWLLSHMCYNYLVPSIRYRYCHVTSKFCSYQLHFG